MLRPRSDGVYLDGTLGGGGHAEAILEASAPSGRVIGIDRDPAALAFAERRLAGYRNRFDTVEANFAEVGTHPELVGRLFDGAVLDLGVSSAQIDELARGFSYRQDAPLDMRMGPRGEPARDWLSRADFDTLADVLRKYGEERHARRIARAIVREREREPIETTGRLRSIVEAAIPRGDPPIKSVARVFQAIRIVVNDELGSLERGLELVFDRLKGGGRMVVIAYHSLEDRIVKRTFRDLAADCVCPPDFPVCRCDAVSEARILTRRPVVATQEETEANPRARSAKLRAVERRRPGPAPGDGP